MKILDIEKYRNKEGYVENINLMPEELHQLLDYITKLQQENQQLKKQKDDVVEYIRENKNKTIAPYGDNEDIDYEVCLFEEDINELLRMLGEIK